MRTVVVASIFLARLPVPDQARIMFRLSSLLHAFQTHRRLGNGNSSRRLRRRNGSRVTTAGESLEPRQLLTVIEWGGNIDGDWSNAANWSPTFVPGAEDDVIIDASNGIAFEVDLNVNATIRSLTINSPDATLDIEASRILTINEASSFDDGRVRLNTNARIVGDGTLTNNAVVDVLGTTVQITTPMLQNGVLNIGATGSGANVSLTTNGLSNTGTINLGASNSTAARLITNVGESFMNAATGTVNVISAAGGGAEITGDVINEGAVTANADLEFDGRSASVINRGEINIAAGMDVLIGDFNAITFVQESGSLTVNGSLQTDADIFRFTGGLINGTNKPIVTNGTLDLDASGGPIDLIAAGLVALAGDIGTGQVVRLQNDGFREGEITSANGFTNSGTILFERDPDSAAERKAKLRVIEGALTNAAGGVIDIVENDGQIAVPVFNNAGSVHVSQPTTFFFDTVNNSGTFGIGTDINISDRDVTFENTGVLTVAAGNELRLSGLGNTFRQNGGTLQLDGHFVTTTGFALNGGDIVGNSPVVDGGGLAYGGGLTNDETIIARNTVEMESNLPAGQTLIVQADVRTALLRVDDQFTIDGTVRLEQTAGSTQTARIQAGGGNDEIIIGATGTLDLQPGTATQPFTMQTITNRGTLDVNSDVEFRGSGGKQLVNEGQFNVPAGKTFSLTNSGFGVPKLLHEAGSLNVDGTLTAAGTLKSGGGTFEGNGDIIVDSGELEIESGNVVEFSVVARGFVNVIGDLAASQTVRAEAVGTNQTVLIVQDGFTNSGTITFDSINGSASSARLQTGNGLGTLNNAADGTIDVNSGSGNFQFTLTTFNNFGDVILGRDVELTTGDTLNNDGNLVVEAGSTFHLASGTSSRSALNQNSGNLNLLGDLTSSGNLSFNGGNFIGDKTPLLLGGSLGIAAGNTNPATFNVQRSITLNSDLNTNQSINLQPQTTSQLTLSVGNTFANGGAIRFDPADGATGLATIQPTSFTTAVITNNGTLSSLAGSGRIIAGQLVNTGTLSVAGDLNLAGDMIIKNTGDLDIDADGQLTLGNNSAFSNPIFKQQNGSVINDGTFFADTASVFNFDGGTVGGSQPVTLKDSDLNIADGNLNGGHFRFEGNSNDLFDDIAAGQRVDIAAISSAGGTLRVPAGFVNAGELFLDETVATTGDAVLQVGNSNDPITNTETGIIRGDGEVRASTLTNAGTIAPGASPGSLNIDADLILQSSSVIAIELGGVTPGTLFDQLVVDHDTTLAGELQLSISDGFVPTAGNTFEVLTFPSVQGDFATVSGTDAGNGAVLEKNLNAQDVTIEVIAPPGLTIGDVNIVEGDSGTINAVFTVHLEANGNPVSVDFATEDQTARAGEDYTATSGTLNFASNETSKTIRVPIIGDERDENEETFRVLLNNAVNAAIPDPEGIATINDGEDTQPVASFAEATSNITEDGGTLTLAVQLDRPSGLATRVDFNVTGGTATNRSGSTGDFNLAAGTLNFAADQTSLTIEIPITDDAAVEGIETIELTLSNAVDATIGATSNHTVRIVDNDFHPDLLVASSNSPDSANRGGTISVEWVVRNAGQGDAIGSLSDRVYFSTDDILDAGDAILASRNSSSGLPLAAGATYTATQNVNLPNVEPGDYFLIFETDSSNQIMEDSDANNTRAEAIELLGPDLIISTASAPAFAAAGADIAADFAVQNLGPGDADRRPTNRIFFSEDSVLDAGDAEVFSVLGRQLGASESEQFTTTTLTIPEVAPGEYFLIFSADHTAVQFENDETNNLFTKSITVQVPDLIISAANSPATANIGDAFDVDFTVQNTGDASAETARIDRVYLSTDEIVDANDRQVFSRSNNGDGPLAPNGTQGIDGTVTIPQQFAAGNYFLLFVADETAREFESNEANNLLSRPLRIEGADLVVESVTVPSTAKFGDEIEITWTVRNTGTLTVDANVLDQVRLATTESGSVGTVLLSERAGGKVPLAPGESYTQTFTATPPLSNSSTPGDFFIVVRTDAGSQIVEQLETNNTNNAAIELTLPPLPDIVVSDISIPVDAANSGDQLEVEWTVTNNGTAPAVGPWNTSLTLVDADDNIGARSLGSLTFNGNLQPGESIVRRTTVSLPEEPGFEGAARVVVRIDTSNNVFEHDGDDNNRALDDNTFELSIREFPNLVVSDIQVPATAVSGETTQIQYTISNTGGAPTAAPQWFDQLFLSVDQTLDPPASEGADMFLASTKNVSFLNPGESYTSTVDVVLPDNLDGNFFVFAATDRPSRVNERNNEGDNVTISEPIQITLPPAADLQVTNINAPLTVFSEEEFLVEWTVTNNGDAPTETNVIRDRVLLSPDEGISFNDVLLGNSAVRDTLLQPGESYTASMLVSVPVGLQGNDLFLLVQTDTGNDVFEHSNEANNVSTRPINVLLNPSPDLFVENIDVPATVRSGTAIDIAYTAVNRGLGETSATRWTDRIILSEDNILSDDDRFFGNVIHTGALGVQSTYTETLTCAIPNDLTGDFFVFVIADFGDDVFESVFENNNSLVSNAAVTFESLPADLVVTNVTAPTDAINGETVTIEWTVRNDGVGDTILEQFTDQIRTSTDDIVGNSDDRVLGRLTHGPRLAPGESVTVRQIVQVPDNAVGQLKIYVRTDSGGNSAVFESDEDNNTSELLAININQQLADIVIDDISVQTDPPAGRNFLEGDIFEVTWTGKNQGTARTSSNIWRDEVFLSLDGTLERNEDIRLGTAFHSGALTAGETYTQTRAFVLPNIGGEFRVIIVGDTRNNVVELDETNNIFVAEAADVITVDETPDEERPDMQIAAVDAPETAVSGQQIDIHYDVTSTGGDIIGGSWFDTIFLSQDEVFDNRDTALRTVFRSGQSISKDTTASFSATVDLPLGLAGDFFVFVRTNSADGGTRVQESNRNNNFGHDNGAMTIELLPPSDLVVGAIPVPSNAMPGQDVSVTYTVSNQGADTARGRWADTLFVSTDEVFDSSDIFLGEVPHVGDLAPGESYTETLTIPLPGIEPGEHFVIVRSDIRNQIPEISEANNINASLDAVDVDVPELQLSVPGNGVLAEGDFSYFKVEVPAGETLRITLDSESPDAFNQLFVSFDKVPQLADFDFTANRDLGPDQEILVPITRAGTYFILAQGVSVEDAAPPAFTIIADVLEFSALSTKVDRGSTRGEVTIPIRGAKLSPITEVKLRASDGSEVVAQRVRFVDQSEVWATFDLSDATAGEYDIVVEDGNQIASLDSSFNVTDGPVGELQVNIRGPENVGGTARRDPVFTFQVEYENVGDTDIISPIFEVKMAGAEIQTPGLDGVFRNDQQVLAVNRPGDGPAGILAPGASNTLTFVAKVGGPVPVIPATPEDFAAGIRGVGQGTSDAVSIETRVMTEALLQQLIDDKGIRQQVVDRVVASIGESGEELAIALAENATHLSQLGDHISDPFQLLLFEINHLEHTATVEEVVTSIDAIAPSTGLPLFIERAFAPNEARVGNGGIFGQGWTHNFDFRLTDNETFVQIDFIGRTERYRREADDSFVSSDTDPSTLTVAGSRFVHTDQAGTRRIFGPAGELQRIESRDGSSLSFGYENLLLTSIAHSNGATFTLTYNADARVATVTDHAGQVTTYTYDTDGSQLLHVDGPAGQSLYEYDDALGFSNGLLLTAQANNGVTRRFEYDQLGRYSNSSRGDLSELNVYSYDESGGIAITDADGNRRTVLFAENGAIGQVFDQTGDVVNVLFDRNGLVDGTAAAGGLVTQIDHDLNGNVSEVVDAAGGATTFAYNANGRLTQSTDAVGIAESYAYDAGGRLSGITYADGSTSVATYSDEGELLSFIGRDAVSESFSYNEFGQVTQVKYSNGEVVDFTYDVRGNLLTATDGGGTTTHVYDSANRLIRVDYPNGRFLTFEFDAAGRRTSSTDSTGFITRYEYDAANRLSAVRNGDGTAIAEYQHDDRGQLVREDSGNGAFTTYSYDHAGRMLTRINHSPDGGVSSSFAYTYDRFGRQQSVSTLDGRTNYEYDVKGQLVKITLPDSKVMEYEYDAAGNRKAVIDDGVRTEYTRNELGLYTRIGNQISTYDDAGRLIRTEEGGSVTTFEYDERGRLMKTDQDGDVTEFEYDALSRRIGRNRNGQRIEVLTDPFGIGLPVAEFNNDGSVNNRIIHGNGLAGTIDGNGNSRFFEFDGLGNTVKVNDAAGTSLNEYTILPFGEILRSVETVPNVFRLNGQNGSVTRSTGTVIRGTTGFRPGEGRSLTPNFRSPSQPSDALRSQTPGGNNPAINATAQARGVSEVLALGTPGHPQNPGTVPTDTQSSLNEALLGRLMMSAPAEAFGDANRDINSGFDEGGFDGTGKESTQASLEDAGEASVFERAYDRAKEKLGDAIEDAAWNAGERVFKKINVIRKLKDLYDKGPVGFVYDEVTGTVQDVIQTVKDAALLGETLGTASGLFFWNLIRSKDPNDITGPAGFGDEHWVTAGERLPYQIRFENVAEAGAPAQQVIINSTIDLGIELRSLRFGDIGFGDFSFDVDDNATSINQRFDFTEEKGVFVDVKAALDPRDREITWTFTAIDPATGLIPADPTLGFLPPNVGEEGIGEGFANYSVGADTDLPSGTEISAQATIFFDANAPLDTNVFVNTIDSGRPTSEVNPLPELSGELFDVSWTGGDEAGGSGIGSYDIFVSTDGGSFEPWLLGTTARSAPFAAELEHTYRFFSVAIDNAGNRELAPSIADASTRATADVEDGTAPESEPSAVRDAVDKTFEVTVTAVDPEGPNGEQASGIRRVDVFVAEDEGEFELHSSLQSGETSFLFEGESGRIYWFRTVAVDNAGNVEDKPVAPEAIVIVGDFDVPETAVTNLNAADNGDITVTVTGTDVGGSGLESIDVFLSIDGAAPTLIATVPAGDADVAGIHTVVTSFQGLTDGVEHTYEFFSIGRDVTGNVEAVPGTADQSLTGTFNPVDEIEATGIDVSDGLRQRSFVRFVDLDFTSPDGLQELIDAGAITLERFDMSATDVSVGTGEAVDLSGAVFSVVGSSIRVDFGIEGIGGNRNSRVGDGFYRIMLDATGNGRVDQSFEFHRIFGDVDGDGDADRRDVFRVLRGLRRRNNPEFDINGDGRVNFIDLLFTAVESRRRKRLDNDLFGMLDD